LATISSSNYQSNHYLKVGTLQADMKVEMSSVTVAARLNSDE
jgi:hypothetical protein